MENVLRFEHPEYLYWLLIIPVLIIIYILIRLRQDKVFKRFADVEMRDYLVPQRSGRRSVFKFIVFLLMIACLILGLANLQSGSKMEEVKREGIDLYIAVDVSNSMNAQDIVPSRLDRSKQAINKLIGDLQGDRLGVIVFAEKAFVQLPITTDYAAAKMFLASVNTNSVASQGTAIGEAINLAMNSFSSDERSKAIIIISDGEDHENDAAMSAAKEAAKKGIKIYTIGMGLPDGAPIPEYNQYGRMVGYKKDKSGNTIVTRLDEEMLRRIADAGGGMYVRANNSNVGLEKIYDDISKLDKTEIETQVFTDYEDQFQWFVGAAIILLLVLIFMSSGKKGWETKFNIFERKGVGDA
ncbi:MAG: VWA domain-containing protein [Bacteroidales bacterium]|nr:VWA domain-containing protein [Bacteroidales bacterium]